MPVSGYKRYINLFKNKPIFITYIHKLYGKRRNVRFSGGN